MTLQYLVRDIASRLHHRGVFICPEHADVLADLREIAGLDLAELKDSFDARKIEILAAYGYDNPQPQNKPFAFAEGMAIIPVHGLLINRLSWGSSYATGYNFISSQLQAAMEDSDVKGVIFDVNSSGGIASGCGECANEIFAARAEKPSIAVVDSKAYSAAYYLASAAGKMVATPSGGVGSIGCVAMHADYSGALDDIGIKITMIHAGAQKVDGNPFEKLSARARAGIQRDVDYHYGMFTDAVARYRDMPSEDVRDTEAACYLPPEALDRGLIDGIETPTEAVANFGDDIGTGVFSMGGTRSASSGGDWKCGASRSLSVKETGSWDGPAATERMLDAAGFNGNSPNVTEARAGFLAYDAGDPKKKGSYKLPFADIIDGKKTAMRSGLDAAAQRLSGTDIPQSVKDEAQAVIDHYKPKDSKDDSKSGVIDMDEAQVKAMVDEAVASALSRDRERRLGITTCEEAKGRKKLAAHLADNTSMTVDEAKAILAASPKKDEEPPPANNNRGGNPLDAAMNSTRNPNMRPDGAGDGAGDDKTPQARAAGILGAFGAMTGNMKLIEHQSATEAA